MKTIFSRVIVVIKRIILLIRVLRNHLRKMGIMRDLLADVRKARKSTSYSSRPKTRHWPCNGPAWLHEHRAPAGNSIGAGKWCAELSDLHLLSGGGM